MRTIYLKKTERSAPMIRASDPKPLPISSGRTVWPLLRPMLQQKALPVYLAIGLERVGAELGIGIGSWWLFGAA